MAGLIGKAQKRLASGFTAQRQLRPTCEAFGLHRQFPSSLAVYYLLGELRPVNKSSGGTLDAQ